MCSDQSSLSIWVRKNSTLQRSVDHTNIKDDICLPLIHLRDTLHGYDATHDSRLRGHHLRVTRPKLAKLNYTWTSCALLLSCIFESSMEYGLHVAEIQSQELLRRALVLVHHRFMSKFSSPFDCYYSNLKTYAQKELYKYTCLVQSSQVSVKRTLRSLHTPFLRRFLHKIEASYMVPNREETFSRYI